MNLTDLRQSINNVRASDDLKERIAAYRRGNPAAPQTRSQRKRMLIPAIASALVLCFVGITVLLIADPFQLGLSECLPDMDKRYCSIAEISGQAFAVKGDGKIFRYDGPDKLEKISSLPVAEILSDGKGLYYSLGHKIYQYQAELNKRHVIADMGQNVVLDYINADQMIYHYGKRDDSKPYEYWLADRNSGVKKQLLTREDAKYFRFLEANAGYAVFEYSVYDRNPDETAKHPDALYAVNLETQEITCLYTGTVFDVAIGQDIVYFTPGLESEEAKAAGLYQYAPELWSIKPNGQELKKIDLSGVEYVRIQAIAAAGQDLIIATNKTLNTDESLGPCYYGSLYLFRTQSGQSRILQSNLGLIDRLFATEHYYCYYDMGNSQSPGQEVFGKFD